MLSTVLQDSSRKDLDDLLVISDELCSSTDDFVATLDVPQDSSEVKVAAEKLEKGIDPLRHQLTAVAKGKDAMWLQTFEKQLQQARSLSDLLVPEKQTS